MFLIVDRGGTYLLYNIAGSTSQRQAEAAGRSDFHADDATPILVQPHRLITGKPTLVA